MQNHIDQGNHNQSFHDCIEKEFKEQFYDWKITSLFYVALHFLKALAAKRGIDIGQTHIDIEKNVNPDRHNAQMRIKKNAWIEYKSLFRYSHTARYEGITDIKTFEKLKQIDHSYCKEHLKRFKAYLKNHGLDIVE